MIRASEFCVSGGIGGGNGYVVEKAEAHGPAAFRVVAGGADKSKDIVHRAGHNLIHSRENPARC
jgi:hypothetical protein